MTWFRIDDGFWGHEKVTELSDAALALWVQAGSWTARYRKDGSVPRDIFKRLGRTKRAVQELIEAGLWLETPEGYAFHDFSEWQPQIVRGDEQREQAAERQRKSRTSRVTTNGRHETPSDPITCDPVTARASPSPLLSSPLLSDPIRERESARAQAGEPGRQGETERVVRQEFARRFEAAEGSLWTRSSDPGVATLAAWLSSLSGELEANLARTLDTFFADAWCRSQHFPIAHLARDAHKYFEPREAPTVAKSTPHQQLAALRAEHKTLVDRGEFGDEMTRVLSQIRQLEKDLDGSRGGEPRRAFGR